ncbi:MAG TPA: 50S ribosomal protein L25 [Halanaerobiales bacterium]|nr:50S ribosomal protein L25 [Halanaerobiales bacterium]
MERYSVKVETREGSGKGVARQLRRKGLLPGVVYGKKRDPQPLIVNPEDLKRKMGGNAIFELELDGDKETVMVKDLQRDPVSGALLHIDFLHITMDEKITVSVPINLTGEPFGVKEGGVMQQLLREISIQSLPLDIPDELELDISELDLGDSLLVGDFDVPEKIDIITPLDEVVVTIVAPTELIEEEEEEEEEEFMEPEVIGEEGEEEAEGEAEETEEEEE